MRGGGGEGGEKKKKKEKEEERGEGGEQGGGEEENVCRSVGGVRHKEVKVSKVKAECNSDPAPGRKTYP